VGVSLRATIALVVVILLLIASNVYFATREATIVTSTETITTTLTNIITSHLVKTITTTTTIPKPKYPMVIVDALNRSVTIRELPVRVVSCAPSITEIIAVLNLTNTLVGIDEYSDYPKCILELKAKNLVTVVGGVTTLSVERIAMLNPDIVFVDANLQREFIPKLEELNITVVAISANTVEEVMNNIILIGNVMNRSSTAYGIVDVMRARINNIQQLLSAVRVKMKVLTILWLEPIWTTGNNTFMNDIIRLAEGYNIFVDAKGWITVSPETILARDPDVIIVGATMMGLKPEDVKEKIMSIPGLRDVKAVREDRVYILYGQAENIFERPGPRVVEAIELLAKILYPEMFNVSIPNVIGDEYQDYIEPLSTW